MQYASTLGSRDIEISLTVFCGHILKISEFKKSNVQLRGGGGRLREPVRLKVGNHRPNLAGLHLGTHAENLDYSSKQA